MSRHPDRGGLMAIAGTVSGVVQGVGFRFAAVDAARRLGIAGWIRNLADGRVEVFAQGPQSRLEAFVGFLREGPRSARVTTVDIEPAEPDPELRRFGVR